MTVPRSVTGLAAHLASHARYSARTAATQSDLAVLAAAYDEHLSNVANAGLRPACEHVSGPPYITVCGDTERGWCAACAKEALPSPAPLCTGCTRRTRVVMFPFGDILVAGHVCPDCGPAAGILRDPGDTAAG